MKEPASGKWHVANIQEYRVLCGLKEGVALDQPKLFGNVSDEEILHQAQTMKDQLQDVCKACLNRLRE